MQGVLQGFGVVLVLIGVGVATARFMPRQRHAIATGLTPLIYYITNPALLFVLLSETDLRAVVGVFTPIALLTAIITSALFAISSRFLLKTPMRELPSSAMSASYVNAGNIGVPLALYAVGSTAPVVSVLLAQLLILAPLYLCLFALVHRHSNSGPAPEKLGKTILRSVANPVTVATLAGALFSILGWRLPAVLHDPVSMLGEASIPLLLLAFGISLIGQRPLQERRVRAQVLTATAFKALFMPALAWTVAHLLFHLDGVELLGVVVMAALPTAQNVLLFAQQFTVPHTVPRDVILLSTLLTLPVILIATLLLGP